MGARHAPGHDLGRQLLPGLEATEHLLGHPFDGAGTRDELDEHPGVAGGEVGALDLAPEAQERPAVRCGLDGVPVGAVAALAHLIEDGEEQVGHGREVVEERRLAAAGARGDRPSARAGEALLDEDLARRTEQGLPRARTPGDPPVALHDAPGLLRRHSDHLTV